MTSNESINPADLWCLVLAYADARVDEATTGHTTARQYRRLAESNLRDALKSGAAQGQPEPGALAWTINQPPNEKCRYDHCTAETPFGRFLITWKGWKEHDCPTVDETPWGEFAGPYASVKDAQEAMADEWSKRLRAALAPSITPLRSVVDEPDSSGHQVES